MVDRVYKGSLPEFRRRLRALRREFTRVSPRTEWIPLRIDPLLRHVGSLERTLASDRFSGEAARLRRGVVMFHSDLVYLRTNLQALERELEREKARASRRVRGD